MNLNDLPPHCRAQVLRDVQAIWSGSSGDKPGKIVPTETSAKPAISKSAYNRAVVVKFFTEEGLPEPVFELYVCFGRKWRFDLAWPEHKVALEVQGGIFTQGRHTRGAALLREWEKLNIAATLGWRILYCQPKDLCTHDTAMMIYSALNHHEH